MTSAPQQAPIVVLITGASGFVGRHLIALLLSDHGMAGDAAQRPVHIIAATYHAGALIEPSGVETLAGWNPAVADPRVTVVSLDICDPVATSALMAKFRPEQIYHLAARASGADADRDRVFKVNIAGTRNLLEASSALSPLPRVLLASTGYVYGSTDPARPAREEDAIGPPGRYGAYADSKIEMETMARGYSGLALVARAFGHTGPGQTPTFAIPSFARQLARIEAKLEFPELSVGNLAALRDMLDVRDVVRAYQLLMLYGTSGEIFNVALGKPRAMREILEMLISRCTVPVTVRVDPNRLRPVDVACSSGDASRLYRLAGWTPNYRLEETLDATLHYWRELVKV